MADATPIFYAGFLVFFTSIATITVSPFASCSANRSYPSPQFIVLRKIKLI